MSLDRIASTAPKSLEEAVDLIGELVDLVRDQQARIDSLEQAAAEAGKSSRNSHKAPSTDSDAQRKKRKKKTPSKRAQGAQPGHEKHERELLDEAELDAVHDHLPGATCACGGHVELDGAPFRHQVFDVPPIRPVVVEHRVHTGCCRRCARRHRGALPPGVPSGQMGPGLVALIATLSGQYHLSTRKIRRLLAEVLGVEFSLGAVSEAQGRAIDAMAGPYLDIGRHVRDQRVVHADETRHFRGEQLFWMWVLACPDAAWFVAHASRGKHAADQLLGDTDAVVVTDDYVGYDHVPIHRRQLCWAHLLRHFVAVSERVGNAGRVGAELVAVAEALFALRREQVAGSIDTTLWLARSEQLRARCRAALTRGARLRIDGRTRTQCRRWLEREAMFWTHLADPAIPIDNNAAERALRSYVIWRKLSYAVQSHRGNQFRPMVLSIVATAERLGRNAYEYLRTVLTEHAEAGTVSTLLPKAAPALPAHG